MNKIKSTFLRHSKDQEEKKRSDVFIKRLTEDSLLMRKDPQLLSEQNALTGPPKVQLEDLSEIESSEYLAWWKDLDPFDIGKSDNIKVFKFVSGCNLPDDVLEKILLLFQNEKNGLNKEQFFAMLRLIAHAQNGRSVNRDMVHLGAPLPRFQTQAIEALIQPARPSSVIDKPCDPIKKVPSNSSWNSAISLQEPNMPSWMINTPAKVAQTYFSTNPNPNTTFNTYTPPRQYTHSRSRSVPYATTNVISTPADPPADDTKLLYPSPGLYQFDTIGASKVKQKQQRVNHSGHASLNSDSLQRIMDGGHSLLLTQGFKPRFNDDEEKEEENQRYYESNNISPASSNDGGGKYSSNNPYINNHNPFDTDDSLASTPRQEYTPPSILPHSPPYYIKSSLSRAEPNIKLNSHHIPPPPVPPQSTKPTCPKYARR